MGRLGFVGYFLWLFILGCSSSDGAGTTAAMDSAVDGDAMSPNDGTAPALIDGGVGGLDGDAPDVARSTRDGGATSIDQGVGADAGGAGQWRLVWSDEFEGDRIDPTHWRHEVNCWGGGNNEDQCYVDDPKNSYVRDGTLHLVALNDSPSGAVGGPDNNPAVVTKGHSSARLLSQGLAEWTYGRIEARAKLPCGQGLWPAIWMMPSASEYGGWAASGEIDIMEAVNLDCEGANHEVHGTLHYGGGWPRNVHTGASTMTRSSAVTEFHDFAVEWMPGTIRWYVDGVHFATQSNWCSEAAPYPAPFDKDFYLILNVAVGGQWPGPPNAQTTFPQRMVLDYVRVYQCQGGVDCGTADPEVTPVAPLALCNTERMTTEESELWLYRDGVNRADWPGGNHWEQNPGKVVHGDVDEDGDTVWSVRWTEVEGGGNVFIQSSDGRKWDLRNFRANGRLEFKIKAISTGDATALYAKVDSEYPALGQVDILDQLRVGEWATVRVPMETLLANPGDAPLDLGSVWTPFVLEPSWAASGVEVRLNDIRWVRD